ncbi:EmrB/QacA family drug resistance transporter [Burkholderia sp. HI2714]|uniref:MFS transporter n=1 Tax=Burkholderia sp. HI2714 TaxID=2015359 RepID=UPI000B7A43AD|nr:MFS transporter [Burkholderia sp. HI2714]OXJ22600.1 EmrB/QacA family drug resistance transporter [Burkholderia sp. HI2714]
MNEQTLPADRPTNDAGSPGTVSAPQPQFNFRLAVGLIGILLASLSSGLNNRVTDIALPDWRGVVGMGHDEGTWIAAVYEAGEVSGMMVSAWFGVTLSFRRFAIGVAIAFAALAAVFPFVSSYPWLVFLRATQGLVGGLLPPLLMTAALRFLPPGIRLYGMSAYALTATFGPNLATPLAALWTDKVGWQFVYWQVIPPCALAAVLMAWGLPQDPVRLDRFKQFDWRGAILGCGGVSMLVLALAQGERLDWFASPLINALLVSGVLSLTLFFVNEWNHPLPLFKLQMLSRRNFSHGLLTLAGILIVFMSASALPTAYLSEVRGYRPLEIGPLTLTIAIPQLIAAPLAAMLCNFRWLDSRVVLATGLALLSGACFAGSFLTSDWIRDNFYLLQAMHALGQPLAVLPVLMGATGVVRPQEGPFASAMFNTTRGMATVLGATLVESLMTHREHFHSNVLVDQIGQRIHLLSQSAGLLSRENLHVFARQVRQQALVMSVADVYLTLMALAVSLIALLLLLPERAYPPGVQPGSIK